MRQLASIVGHCIETGHVRFAPKRTAHPVRRRLGFARFNRHLDAPGNIISGAKTIPAMEHCRDSWDKGSKTGGNNWNIIIHRVRDNSSRLLSIIDHLGHLRVPPSAQMSRHPLHRRPLIVLGRGGFNRRLRAVPRPSSVSVPNALSVQPPPSSSQKRHR